MPVAEHVVEFPHEGVPVGDHWRERVLDQEVAEPLRRGARQEGQRVKHAALLVGEGVRVLHENDH